MTTQKQFIESKIEQFWKELDGARFIKTTNSITDEVEHLDGGVEDQEAVIIINGEFDKYHIENFLSTALKEIVEESFKDIVESKRNPPDTEPYLSKKEWYNGWNVAIDQITSRHKEFIN